MKTAISINDGLLREADETARLMKLSRSRSSRWQSASF